MTRLVESLEHFFRHRIAYPLLRMAFRNPVSVASIDITRIRRILVFRYDRIGDMIVTTPILRILKQLNPQIQLDVLASKTNAEIVLENRWVDRVIVLETNWVRKMRQLLDLRKQRYDVVLNFIFNRTTGPGILANLVAPHGCKVGQGPERYAFYFNRLVQVKRFKQHMLESYVSMVEQTFGISVDRSNLAFEIEVADASRQVVDEWLAKHSLERNPFPASAGSAYIVLNPSGKDQNRSLSIEQVAALAHSLSESQRFRVVVLDPPGDAVVSEALRVRKEFQHCLSYRTLSPRPLIELASLIEGALFVISPDTSIVHFASAMKRPVLAIYAPMNASQEWLPHEVPYDVVWAQEREQVSEIAPQLLIEGAARFVARILGTGGSPSPESK